MTVFASASFTVGIDTVLASYSPEIGGPLVLHPSYSGSALADASLGRAYLTSVAAAAYYATGTPPGADYDVQIEFFHVTTISANIALMLRFDTTADTGILLRMNLDSARFEMMDRVAGANGTSVNSSTHYPTAGNSVIARIKGVGTDITVFFNDIQDTALNFTTAITATGRAGIRYSGPCTATTGIHMDNFSAFTAEVLDPSFRPNVMRPAMFLPGIAK
jgi:hypothetical protein